MSDIFTVATRVGTDGSMEFWDKTTGNPVFNIGNANGMAQYAKFTLTPTQVKALHGTPVTLFAAPGAGKVVQIIDAVAYLNFQTTQYAAGSTVQILQNSIAVATTTAALINGGAAALIQLAFPAFSTTASLGAANSATTITASAGEFTTGDSPINLHVWYSVITV